MKVTIKKSVESKGMLSKKKFFALSLWVHLSPEEIKVIEASNLNLLLFEREGNDNEEYQAVRLTRFLQNSGPAVIEFQDAFSAHAAGEGFREEITNAANAIKAYQDGLIMGEESFEL